MSGLVARVVLAGESDEVESGLVGRAMMVKGPVWGGESFRWWQKWLGTWESLNVTGYGTGELWGSEAGQENGLSMDVLRSLGAEERARARLSSWSSCRLLSDGRKGVWRWVLLK